MKTTPYIDKSMIANAVYKDEDGNEIYAYSDGDISLSCWKLSFLEKIKIIFTGKLWVLVLGPQVPMKIVVKKNDILD